jgi:hypothetical protein
MPIFLHNLVQEARVLNYTSLKMRARDKHFSLLDPFVSYENDDLL